ncbi:hypothetical protein KL930_004379 [Ogataea haglerorum]|uniref:Zn(2)-C6 fungal-type domain-containing protein n=1 Tax=Ogataea haglerorum TaxID=1937702 RepID=A0AAN6HZI1_9ASCO|nr:uncharacterized protein KL911_004134 [Ogataea haglerorum]KAG7691650.1 hypothetical protein KL951_005342 [Ogataea haglerorum]KAG7715838.1 hypothetical protein KL913_003651 [Ogataea haglerorum]KAG7716598.1 hypothetical protein KL949_003889 [Ogataea haglerorum]KAG7725615.1 hypothetical protein KL933_004181 [Ogataea haglerorum]KAG7728403.1 hypothetical protein KL948_004270 [Ogataea haglerorum]
MPRDKRSRKGCLTCRQRRVKCDACRYDQRVLWEEDAFVRGIAFGRSEQYKRIKQQQIENSSEEYEQTLSQRVASDHVPWLPLQNTKILFINITEQDFNHISERDDETASTPSPTPKQPCSPQISHPFPSTFPTPSEDAFLLGALQEFEYPYSIGSPSEFVLEPKNKSSLANLGPQERELLLYFINSICPVCVCYPDKSKISSHPLESIDSFRYKLNPETNPYLYLIVPLAAGSTMVLNSILAASAYQLFLLGKKEFEEISDRYTKQVLGELPHAIGDIHNLDEILATIIMLCFKEISSNCGSGAQWTTHLAQAKELLKETRMRNSENPLFKFFTRYFISHEVMGETAWVGENHSNDSMPLPRLPQPIFDDPHLETLRNDGDTRIDLVLGCSAYLISIIHRISMLGKCYEDLELETSQASRDAIESEIWIRREHLHRELEELCQEFEPTPEVSEEDAHYIETIAEIKRLTAIIYLFARIDLEAVYQHDGRVSKSFYKRHADTQQISKHIVSLMRSLPDIYMSLLWPLFVIGIVSTVADEDRWFVLNAFTTLQKTRELGSVRTACSVVTSVWKEKDLGCDHIRWRDMIREKASTLSLA